MHQGKHQEYEKRLHDALIATSGVTGNGASVVGSGASKVNGKTFFYKNIEHLKKRVTMFLYSFGYDVIIIIFDIVCCK